MKKDVVVKWIDSGEVNDNNVEDYLKDVDGILVPGGFGFRASEGKIAAIKYARENNVPYFGICLGMQLATVEFARNVLGLEEHTQENLILAHLIQLLIYCLSKRILKI